MDDVDAVRACQFDHALEKVEIDAMRGWIARKTENHHLRLRERFADRALEFGEEIHVARHAHRAYVGACNDCTVDMDRITRVRNQHRVTTIERRKHQVRQALLRSDGDDRLRIGIELDPVAALIPGRDRTAQTWNTL